MIPALTSSAAIVIFGASGDLTRRKLIPALYNLCAGGYLPASFRIFCVDFLTIEPDAFKSNLLSGVQEFSRNGPPDPAHWQFFADQVVYLQGDFLQRDTFTRLKTAITAYEKTTTKRGSRLFYYAVAPRFIETLSEAIYKEKLAPLAGSDRIVIEKPFGTDLVTAKALNAFLTKRFAEKQLYRIDHYLGKETVQNIMAFRFANFVFEPLWNRDFIDHIQISVTEKVSVGSRGGYYDSSGALRDMVQNHLMQLLCIVAMECPGKYEAETIRNAKSKVIKDIRKWPAADIGKQLVRGQYEGYKQEKQVAETSTTETFLAAKLFIDNPRWKDVPFFLRTGKSMDRQSTVISIQFKDTPHKIFKDDIEPNRLIISIQPELEISLLFESKVPGLQMKLKPVEMDFTYNESHHDNPIPEAYEALLLDVLKGDATLFMRADQVEAAWKAVMPILDYWKKQKGKGMLTYPAGSGGPEAATRLLKPYAKSWIRLPEPVMVPAAEPLK